MYRLGFLLVLVLSACGDAATPPAPALPDEPEPDTTRQPPADSTRTAPVPTRATPRPLSSDAPTPYDRAAMVFDTLEPQTPRIEIQPRPDPPPRTSTPPAPRPSPPVAPPAQMPGSCDVRTTESFCFAYTGSGWSAPEARSHCGNAPDSGYRTAACPEDGAIATCRFVRDDAPTQEILYTYYAPYAPALAELACPGDFERIEGD